MVRLSPTIAGAMRPTSGDQYGERPGNVLIVVLVHTNPKRKTCASG